MASDFERMLFEDELASIQLLPEASRWKVERDDAVPLGIKVLLHSIKEPAELYLARFRWTDYFKAPSLKFLNLINGSETDPTAWPRVRGFRPTTFDACVSWTSEGHGLHPEWVNSPATAYSKKDAPMQFAVLTLQFEMDSFYEGRWRP